MINSSINANGIYLTYFDILGYVAILFSVMAFLAQNKNKMRLHGMTSTVLFGVSIYYYNGINGLFVSSVSFLVKLLSIKFDESKLEILKIISPFIAFIFFIYFNDEGIIGILPAISLIFIIIADLQTDLLRMKQWYYGSAFCWLTYGILLGSIPAIIFDILGLGAITYSIITVNYPHLKK